MNIVTIKEVKGVVTCAEDGTAEHTFNVKNATDKALKVGMQLAMDGPTSADWLAIEGSTDHELDVETMTQISVKIQVPPDCAPGKYSYRLRVYDPANPGEIFVDGDPVYFEVAEKKAAVPEKKEEGEKKPFKWWIPVAIAVGVVVIGVVVWALWPASEVKVPQLKGMNLSAALQQISKSGLSFNDEKDLIIQTVNQSAQHAKILNQKPLAGEVVAPESAVKLWLGRYEKQGKKGKFVIKDLSKVQKMKGIKMSSGFVKREVAPQSE